MYLVIVCPECCCHSQIIEDGRKTTKCQKCGAKISTDSVRIFGSFENIADAVECRTVIQAQVSGPFDPDLFRAEKTGIQARNNEAAEKNDRYRKLLKEEKEEKDAVKKAGKIERAAEDRESRYRENPFADDYDYYEYLERRRNERGISAPGSGSDRDGGSGDFSGKPAHPPKMKTGQKDSGTVSDDPFSEDSVSERPSGQPARQKKPKADRIICDVIGRHVIEEDDCRQRCLERGLDEGSFEKMLKRLIDEGIVYRPAKGFLGLVPE
ncbi:MAG: hypothetical protein II940_01875 [Methanosarcinaceae archaeon]|nr:hypothetical protein [Methanosarcinaceae archaeon]